MQIVKSRLNKLKHSEHMFVESDEYFTATLLLKSQRRDLKIQGNSHQPDQIKRKPKQEIISN